MKRIAALLMAYVIFVTSTITAYAGLDSDVSGYMNSIGVMTNITSGGTYKTSDRTYMSGGSMQMRMKKTTIPPVVTFQQPQLRVSCSGLDFNAGLISILNLDLIEKLLQQSGTSLAWGILVGLSYSLPGISNVFEQVQKYTRLLQALEGDACAIGTQLGQKLGESIKESYQRGKSASDIASGAATNMTKAVEKLYNNPTDFVKRTSGNITYDALKAIGIPDSMTYYFMGVFGTVTWHPADLKGGNACEITGNPETSVINYYVKEPELANDKSNVIASLVDGNEKMKIYTCGNTCNNTCLSLEEGNLTFDGIKKEVRTALTNVVNGLAERQVTLSSTDTTYLKAPVFPELTKYIIMLSIRQRNGQSVAMDIDALSTFYAYWLLEYTMTYINSAMGANIDKLLTNKQVDATTAEKILNYRKSIAGASNDIAKIFQDQRDVFMMSFSYYHELETITKKQFKLSDYKWPGRSFGMASR